MSLQTGGNNFQNGVNNWNAPGMTSTAANANQNWSTDWNRSQPRPATSNVSTVQPYGAYPSLPGRIIYSENDIAPGEVPMDGQSVGVFLQQDLQRVYVKKWGGDGRIYTNVYVLEQPTNPDQAEGATTNDILNTILARLDGIDKTLARQKKNNNPNYRKNNFKPNKNKEVETHE